jgi:hypothetical protein
MDMVGIHQVFEVRRQDDGKPKGKRDQNNQGEGATISRLGWPCGYWETVGQRYSIQKSGLAEYRILVRREVLNTGLRENGDILLRRE